MVVFLVVVTGVVGYALAVRHPRPDLSASIALLGDGDLDGDERKVVLENMLERRSEAATDRERWAVLLAAVALGERGAFDAARATLEPLSAHVLAAADLRWLALGDTVLHNVLAAMQADARGDAGAARVSWQQVQNQVLLTGDRYALAGDLAAAALK
ncbi:MAG: hypothetical protein R3F29_01620 [Planctomycetota bacterium]